MNVWFIDKAFQNFLQRNHPRHSEDSVLCTLRNNGIDIKHQVRAERIRNINSGTHTKKWKAKRNQLCIYSVLLKSHIHWSPKSHKQRLKS